MVYVDIVLLYGAKFQVLFLNWLQKPIDKFKLRNFLDFSSERCKLVAELTELVGSLLFKSSLNSNLILAGFQHNLVRFYRHPHSYLHWKYLGQKALLNITI